MIKKEQLQKGWYKGKGRNSDIAYWTGETFLTIGEKFGEYIIKDEGLYQDGWCFKPMEKLFTVNITKDDMKIYDKIAHVSIEDVIEKDAPIGLIGLLFRNEAKKDFMIIADLYKYSQYHKWLRKNFPVKDKGVHLGDTFILKNSTTDQIPCQLCLIECGIWRLIADDGKFVGKKTEGLRFDPVNLLEYGQSLYDNDQNLICKYGD